MGVIPSGRTRRQFLAAVGAVGLAGCGKLAERRGRPEKEYELNHTADEWSRYDPEWTSPSDSPLSASVQPEVLVENLEIPWDLAFARTGELFVTERTGRIRRFDGERLETVAAPDAVIDAEAMAPGPDDEPFWETWFVEGGEGGMLGIAVHPKYPEAPYVFVYFTAKTDGGKVNRVVRYDVDADDPASTGRVVVDDIPADNVHNGGRIAFGPENYLWITTGDAGEGPLAQDTSSLAGSVLRVNAVGDPAPGNPDLPGDDADPRVYTYGHRNPQCITWLPDATPVVTEHGPDGNDEVNRLVPGGNYGWPEARKADEYEDDPAYRRPLVNTPESWAPSGGVFYTGDAIPAWRDRLVFGSLVAQRINVVTLADDAGDLPPVGDTARGMAFAEDWHDDAYAATAHWTLADVLGRVRHVEQGPDGHLYAVTSNRDGRPKGDTFPRARDDVLVRLTPTA
ncbi:PQQ-dependent sugar dehydrogenase [Halorussus caseinilyticus]|uniref:PQQ-dependent sugar dehydrogenase n=1 Tax=Halorussus caseinilyticus TaxID=3034025 RepID=A0ABD5WQM4_9EURY|nr:PQQ-dependent sugar dehydrogenase [Halorussus sp. DT72]